MITLQIQDSLGRYLFDGVYYDIPESIIRLSEVQRQNTILTCSLIGIGLLIIAYCFHSPIFAAKQEKKGATSEWKTRKFHIKEVGNSASKFYRWNKPYFQQKHEAVRRAV